MNMKASIDFPIASPLDPGDHLVEDAVEAILIEKNKRIQRLLAPHNCEQLDALIDKSGSKPTVAYFGSPTHIKGSNSRLSFLKHVQ